MKAVMLRLAVFLLPTTVGLWLATQAVARAYGYHPALGVPLLTLWHVSVYAPSQFVGWLWHYGAMRPDIFHGALWWLYGGVGVSLASLGLLLWRSQERQVLTTYGSARFAERRDIEKSGLW